MRLIRRVLSWPLEILGFVFFLMFVAAALYDTIRAAAYGPQGFTRLGEVWFELSPETLNLAQAAIQRGVSPFLWDPVIQTLLGWPAVVSLFLLAAVFGLIARLVYRPTSGRRGRARR